MQVIVTELCIEDAVKRARERLDRADRRLASALAARSSGLSWMALGALVVAGGFAGLAGMSPARGAIAVVMGALPALGGAFLGHGAPMWWRARAENRQRSREWRHALEVLRLREQQAMDNPALTVEVLERADLKHPPLDAKWHASEAAPARYVQ